jgi:hypothetical protein
MITRCDNIARRYGRFYGDLSLASGLGSSGARREPKVIAPPHRFIARKVNRP